MIFKFISHKVQVYESVIIPTSPRHLSLALLFFWVQHVLSRVSAVVRTHSDFLFDFFDNGIHMYILCRKWGSSEELEF